MSRVLVTGATGFVGRHLVPRLVARGHAVVEAGRRARPGATSFVPVGEIGRATDWTAALDGIDAVVHLAGAAHRTGPGRDDIHAETNDRGTARLAEAAMAAKARRLVFVSSIYAGLTEKAPSAYGRSKLAAEAHVARFADHPGRSGIALRPPLAYGADAPANWHGLQRLAASGMPLPFGSIASRRSLISVGNLCDGIAAAIDPATDAASGTYEISDAGTVTMPEIVGWLREGMGLPRRILPMPPALLRLVARATGKGETVETLLAELTVDPSRFMRAFSWTPRETSRQAIVNSGREFLAAQRS